VAGVAPDGAAPPCRPHPRALSCIDSREAWQLAAGRNGSDALVCDAFGDDRTSFRELEWKHQSFKGGRAAWKTPSAPQVEPGWPEALLAAGCCDVVIVEADGARKLPFKAPAENEPVLPEGAAVVLVVAGADATGRRSRFQPPLCFLCGESRMQTHRGRVEMTAPPTMVRCGRDRAAHCRGLCLPGPPGPRPAGGLQRDLSVAVALSRPRDLPPLAQPLMYHTHAICVCHEVGGGCATLCDHTLAATHSQPASLTRPLTLPRASPHAGRGGDGPRPRRRAHRRGHGHRPRCAAPPPPSRRHTGPLIVQPPS
jgi:hypothetical protein